MPKLLRTPVRKDPLKIARDFFPKGAAHLTADLLARLMERVVFWSAAVLVESQDHTSEVGIVGFRSTEFVVGNRPFEIVLQPPTSSVVANDDVQLAVGPEPRYAAIVIAAQHFQ